MKAIKILFSIVLVLLLISFLFLEPVETTPYFETDYYQSTRAALDSLQQLELISEGELQAGFSAVNLTPKFVSGPAPQRVNEFTEIPLAGYGNRDGAKTSQIHDSLFVKCVALQVENRTNYLVALDLLIVPQEIRIEVARRLKEKFGIERHQLYLSATHTHSSLGGWGEGFVAESFAGPFDARVRELISTQVVTAVASAREDLSPARWGFDSFRAPDFVRNRLVGEKGRVNDRFDFLYFDKEDGKKAVVGFYSAHATVLSGKNMQCSGDYPGYWQRAIEANVPGSTALFFAGSVGSHRPAGEGKDFSRAENIGVALADSVRNHLNAFLTKRTVALQAQTLPLHLPESQIRLLENWCLRPYWGQKLMSIPSSVSLQTLHMDEFILATTPCDFSGELALQIHDALQQDGKHTTISSFNGDYVGYIIPGKYYHFPEYEPRIMGWFGPYMGDYATEMLLRMMGGY
ncbi:MAG: hypothetical protein DWQ10_05415 [Calditrichaeota bacterium]|nr:MAG: hypothetical protein DWQ10_05415 [Calditrichota bacterium]